MWQFVLFNDVFVADDGVPCSDGLGETTSAGKSISIIPVVAGG